MKRLHVLLSILVLLGLAWAWLPRAPVGVRAGPSPERNNGFDLATCLIPRDQIRSGGPPRDGIPSLSSPAFLAASEAGYLADEDRVVGLVRDGTAKAYPLRILVWHEIVNDRIGDTPLAITYCPLCRSVLAFDRRVGDTTRDFGVSGLLYNSNVLMFDRETESLWSQAMMQAVAGEAAARGDRLTLLPCELTSWGDWNERHPDTVVLSTDTGHQRSYDGTPYTAYFAHDETMFPVELKIERPPQRRNKDLLAVVHANGKAKAYPVDAVTGVLTDQVGGVEIRVHAVPDASSVWVEGEVDAVAYMFWFTLASMQPDVPIHAPPAPGPR